MALVVFDVSGKGLSVKESANELQEALNLAKQGNGQPFVRVTETGGDAVYVAADKVLYLR